MLSHQICFLQPWQIVDDWYTGRWLKYQCFPCIFHKLEDFLSFFTLEWKFIDLYTYSSILCMCVRNALLVQASRGQKWSIIWSVLPTFTISDPVLNILTNCLIHLNGNTIFIHVIIHLCNSDVSVLQGNVWWQWCITIGVIHCTGSDTLSAYLRIMKNVVINYQFLI